MAAGGGPILPLSGTPVVSGAMGGIAAPPAEASQFSLPLPTLLPMRRPASQLPVLGHSDRQRLPPSIFNDVIGPVMRGPSSSHCAAAVRIGRLARDLMGGSLLSVLVEFHPSGSLATTHATQGSDMGLFGGLLGWDATDPRLVDSARELKAAGVAVEIRVTDFPAPHPNTYRMNMEGRGCAHTLVAISTGGGMVEVLEVDGVGLSMKGDRFETLVWVSERDGDGGGPGDLLPELEAEPGILHLHTHDRKNGWLIRAGSMTRLPPDTLDRISSFPGVTEVRPISPVLPVLTPPQVRVPFLSGQDLLSVGGEDGIDLAELAVRYESARGGISGEEVRERMDRIVELLEASVQEGLAGTSYEDRILGAQAPAFQKAREEGRILEAGVLDTVIAYVTALMEVKSAMGVIVAAPTAGACGALPGACLGVGHAQGLGREAVVRGMLAAGMVGVLIAHRSTFAAEVCGCQAECGAGSGMAAAALVTMAGGGFEASLGAASMALQNTLGMVCDPVANRVEVPCLGRNVLAASNALACANMALAGFDAVVPLDEVIDTMDAVGKSLPHELRCTALGGLSVTPTSRRIEAGLR